MNINWEKSAELNEMPEEKLRQWFEKYPKSAKRIVVICGGCGEEREVRYDARTSLCHSCAQSGENNPMYGKHPSEKARKKMSDVKSGENNPMYGKHRSEETRKKISEAKIGENHPNWRGGVSFGKYCKLFNNSFKNSVRNDYHNSCFLCGKTKEEEGRKLDVHHVNYNKDCLCGSTCEFVPLCRSCHMKTNNNRQYWEDLIMCYLHPNRYFMAEL